jgi:hypothetical protein
LGSIFKDGILDGDWSDESLSMRWETLYRTICMICLALVFPRVGWDCDAMGKGGKESAGFF